jgi:hypothetical protein
MSGEREAPWLAVQSNLGCVGMCVRPTCRCSEGKAMKAMTLVPRQTLDDNPPLNSLELSSLVPPISLPSKLASDFAPSLFL